MGGNREIAGKGYTDGRANHRFSSGVLSALVVDGGVGEIPLLRGQVVHACPFLGIFFWLPKTKSDSMFGEIHSLTCKWQHSPGAFA